MTHVYTRERHENKNTRFWATYAFSGENTSPINFSLKTIYKLQTLHRHNILIL